MAGYSQTPLAKKLGIQAGFRVKTINAPSGYVDLLQPLPEHVVISSCLRGQVDIYHLFAERRALLGDQLRKALSAIPPNGTIWVSWPKKTSGVASDVNGNAIRSAAFQLGLVDVKVCAVDETWSGLKLVIRVENRCS